MGRGKSDDAAMPDQTLEALRGDPVKQFSIFTANKLGRLHDLIAHFSRYEVHVLAMTVLDTTDSAILRLVTDDPDRARDLLVEDSFPFTESEVLVVEIDSDNKLHGVLSALLEAEININYLYSSIVHPRFSSLLVLSLEDREVAAQALQRHQFKVLNQADISR